MWEEKNPYESHGTLIIAVVQSLPMVSGNTVGYCAGQILQQVFRLAQYSAVLFFCLQCGTGAGIDVELQYSNRGTLTFVAHRVPRRFLFIRWGAKELRMDALSANPNTELTYARNIKIVK